jgi:hypothetical protein
MEYIDNRDWPEYNAKLVRRGEFYLDLSCVKNWGRELREMNRKKRGAPYRYPDTFKTFASIIYTFFRMPYRQLEGFIGQLSTYEPGLVAADYTTLHKRISKQSLEIQIPENDAVVAVDSTGIKVTIERIGCARNTERNGEDGSRFMWQSMLNQRDYYL